MCRSKNDEKGYKRCLAHHPASQYFVSMVSQITGASQDMVRSVMRELNKEGKGLAEVSGTEATALVQKEMFLTENNTEVSAHTKKIARNQLLRALDAVKDGVAGSHFYAWKNLLGRVRSRIGKTLGAVALVGALSLSLNACSAGVPTGPETTSPGTTQSQTATPTPSANTANNIPGKTVVNNGKTVTDAKGTYQTISVDPKASTLKYDSSIVTAGAKDRFSKDEILSGQKFVSNFIIEQGLDSSAYDSGAAGWEAWKKNEADKYIVTSPKSLHDQLLANHDGDQFPSLIINDKGNVNPVAVRDGGPRESAVSMELTQVSGYEYTDPKSGKTGTYMAVRGSAAVSYRATDEAIVKAVLAANPDRTEAELKASKPELFDGKGVNSYPMHLDFAIALEKQKGTGGSNAEWRISGYSNSFASDFLN